MSASLAGRRLLVSAGPTYEDIDPVRFLGNRSSGKMGFAVAAVAAERGAEVTLVAGPVHLPTPEGVRRLDVRSAAQMFAAVMDQLADGQPPCDAYIGAAAVADFTPRSFADNKLKKTPDGDGNLLDNTLLIYGSPMGNSNVHNHKRCPLFFAGHAGGALKGGLHISGLNI